MPDALVFFPTYNEAGNVEALIDAIHAELPEADVLVVDDASQDGTGELLRARLASDARLRVVERPRKLGVGTAHKLALLHARERGYEFLITMDADFSHHPRYLRTLRALLDDHDFVTGSRYVKGGRCDYGPLRQLISRSANTIARGVLGLELMENTTLYRGFRRSLLQQLDVDRIRSEGYSFAVESLFEVARRTGRLAEFPIHFEDRVAGVSKISKAEIYKAIATIARLGVGRLRPAGVESSTPHARPRVDCASCGSHFNVLLHPERRDEGAGQDAAAYSVSSHTSRAHGPILLCLQCGLTFMQPKLEPEGLLQAYADTADEEYLTQAAARIRTFDYNLDRVQSYIAPGARVLDVGSHCGVFLEVAAQRGIDIVGVEPSAWAVQASTQVTERPVLQGTLADLPAGSRFDVVTAWDVLEHFHDPRAELAAINRVLEPGGTLLFSTLMIDNWFPRLAGKHWPWLMDMHLFYFSEGTLSDMLAATGFEVLESRKYCHIITAEYLLSKLASLGVPGADSTLARRLVENSGAADVLIPFRFGDIKLFVCRKVRAPAAAPAAG
jgi:dolichol-phosphate mannosyltransferase